MSVREDVQFRSGNDAIAAWLYRPETSGDTPLLILAHGLGGVKAMRLDVYAERFAAAGYACLVFDYRNLGDSGGQPRQLLDINMQLADWAAAVAYAHTLPGIDHDRIALWGTSFSGGHVIATAARVPGVAAVISQCPFTDGIASARTVSWRTIAPVSVLAIRDVVNALLRKPPILVATAGYPDQVAMINAPDAYDAYLKVIPDGLDVRNEVAARLAIQILTYRPGRLASKVQCPILFCICEADSVAPASVTAKYAAQAPNATIKNYPEGHFDIYVDEGFERAVTDQIAFLDQHLKAGATAAP